MARVSGQPFLFSYKEVKKINQVILGMLSPEEIERYSVVKIVNERIYNEKGEAERGAINDPCLGTMDKDTRCKSCYGTMSDCPGHFGHIDLARPVYHAGMLDFIRKVLRCVCFECSKVLAPRDEKGRKAMMSIKNRTVRFKRVFKASDGISECKLNGCGNKQPKYRRKGLRIEVDFTGLDREGAMAMQGDRRQFLKPEDCIRIFSAITDEDCDLMGLNPKVSRPEWMVISKLAVAPPPVRPSVAMSTTSRSEDDLTYAYQQIIKTNNQLRDLIQKGNIQKSIDELRNNLQYYVATLMDNDIQGQPTQKQKSGKPLKSIRARLKGKEGRLRGNLMGKRVDFSSRSVITPDPSLRLDQLGVPMLVAMNLTLPETVTAQNIDEMRKLVANGPTQWPGAKYIIRHDERQIDLSAMKNRADAHIEPGYIVERQLRDNDYVIFNRQPSLHKMSLMGHRVRVLPFCTFRLNLSVTSPYNADFDGDEMNMHVPQSYETRAEIKEIMAVPKQILAPKDNKPVMGIVQDSLLGINRLTTKESFLTKDEVMQLLMFIEYKGTLPPPAILKPKLLWTGKQMLTLVIPRVNFARTNIGKDNVFTWASHPDKHVLIQDGELLCGVMNKGVVGSSAGGLIHIIWKDQGPDACKDFLSDAQNIVNNWLHTQGFTVGVQDIIASEKTVSTIESTLLDHKKEVEKIIQQYQRGQQKSQPGKTMIESFEVSINMKLREALGKSGQMALEDLDAHNRLKNMVQAGSKGSNLNISQIMACVGQQNVEGKRIPFGFQRRSLPHFSKDDFGPESKGFVTSCYLAGLSPQEFYFHAMGGREGLIDTAVKTAETGYIQRRLIKALEDVMVKYDGTARTSREHIIQFVYGEDGMSAENIENLSIDKFVKTNDADMGKKFKFISNDSGASKYQEEAKLMQSMQSHIVREVLEDEDMEAKMAQEFQQLMQDRDDLRYKIMKTPDDKIHLPVNIDRLLINAQQEFKNENKGLSDLSPAYVIEKNNELIKDLKVFDQFRLNQGDFFQKANDDATWLFKIYLRSILCSKNIILNHKMSQNSFDWLQGEIKTRFERAMVNPGEMVGSIGAQSMGEPATQMTLNTFHFAGVASKNVTLGVPRLKEVINVAKNIKTPSLKIFLQEHCRKDDAAAQELATRIEHATLGDVVTNSAIYYDPDPSKTIIQEDEEILRLYNEAIFDDDDQDKQKLCPWVLRFELDDNKMSQQNMSIEEIDEKIHQKFDDLINVVRSDVNSAKLVLRLRVNDLEEDQDDECVPQKLREFEGQLLNDLTLKGLHEITKVSLNKEANDCAVHHFDKATGKHELIKENWILETDGVALAKVLAETNVDHRKTISNDILEIIQVLGIEAVRLSLINELRFVLGSYDIYVNYRHLATLCDIMTTQGILTSISRHGINRVDSGPLRKCSFEETVEILLEAAFYAEEDPLKGITENIILGQLAPYGTGSFDLVVDTEALNNYAQVQQEEIEDVNAQFTPMIGEATPKYINTPKMNLQTPVTQYGQTPMNEGWVTPIPSTYIQSPMNYGNSNLPSATYKPSQHLPSPSALHSAKYSPTPNAAVMSKQQYPSTPMYTASPAGPSNLPSAKYSVSNPANQVGSGFGQGGMIQASAYSPTTSNYQIRASPSYSPTQTYQTPKHLMKGTPAYMSGGSSAASGNHSSVSGQSPNIHNVASGSVYVPQTPAYTASTPDIQNSNITPEHTTAANLYRPQYGNTANTNDQNGSNQQTPGGNNQYDQI